MQQWWLSCDGGCGRGCRSSCCRVKDSRWKLAAMMKALCFMLFQWISWRNQWPLRCSRALVTFWCCCGVVPTCELMQRWSCALWLMAAARRWFSQLCTGYAFSALTKVCSRMVHAGWRCSGGHDWCRCCRRDPWLTVVGCCWMKVPRVWGKKMMTTWHYFIGWILSCWIMTHVILGLVSLISEGLSHGMIWVHLSL